MRRAIGLAFVLLACVQLGGCFDYEERIVLEGQWSGHVRYRYVVPVDSSGRRSLVRFLPVARSRIEQRMGRAVRNYEVQLQERPEQIRGLRRAAEVRFEVPFARAADLKQLLIGSVVIRTRPGRLAVERRFPVRKPGGTGADRIEKLIRENTVRALANHYMNFSLEYPPALTLNSNRGSLVRAAEHLYTLPLADTLDRTEEHIWNWELKAADAKTTDPDTDREPSGPGP